MAIGLGPLGLAKNSPDSLPQRSDVGDDHNIPVLTVGADGRIIALSEVPVAKPALPGFESLGALNTIMEGSIPASDLKKALQVYFDTLYAPISLSIDVLLYGNGSDGVIDFDGVNTFGFATLAGSTYTLTRTIYGTQITVENGITIIPDGSGLFATIGLTINGTGHIQSDGNAGGTGSAGASLGALSDASGNGRYGQSGSPGSNNSGGLQNTPNGNGNTNSLAGGAGGSGGSGAPSGTPGTGGAVGLAAPIGTIQTLRVLDLLTGNMWGQIGNGARTQYYWGGGSGGGGGGGPSTSSGNGGGGGGAGQVVISAKVITVSASGSITCNGGAGGNGGVGANLAGSGGGGGGGGGIVILVYHTLNNSGTISVNGGAGGIDNGWKHTATLRGTANLSTTANSYATGSTTPTSGALILVAVHSQKGSAPDTPTLAGTGGYNVTWTQIQTATYGATNLNRLTIFRGVASGGGAGTITASFGGVNQTGCQIMAVELTNVNTTTNQGVVQSLAIKTGASGNASANVLSAFSSPKNFVIAFAVDKTVTANFSPKTNWLELSELNVSTTGSLECEYVQAEDDSATWTNTSGVWAAWSTEIAGSDTDTSVAGGAGTIVQVAV